MLLTGGLRFCFPFQRAEKPRWAEVGEKEAHKMAENNGGVSGKGEKEQTLSTEQVDVQGMAEERRQAGINRKKLTVKVEVVGEREVTAMEVMDMIKKECGELMACRFVKDNVYEVTMNNPRGKDRLMEGVKAGETRLHVRELSNEERVVSFLGLPYYIDDGEILDKLKGWGVEPASLIKRRLWPGTKVADGTRYLRVRFNEKVKSLPYSTKFETVVGSEFFRVIHDLQQRTCRLCMQSGHIQRECPEFTCHRCGRQGHYARECVGKGDKCGGCGKKREGCSCVREGEGDVGEIVFETDFEDMGSQGSEGYMEKEVRGRSGGESGRSRQSVGDEVGRGGVEEDERGGMERRKEPYVTEKDDAREMAAVADGIQKEEGGEMDRDKKRGEREGWGEGAKTGAGVEGGGAGRKEMRGKKTTEKKGKEFPESGQEGTAGEDKESTATERSVRKEPVWGEGGSESGSSMDFGEKQGRSKLEGRQGTMSEISDTDMDVERVMEVRKRQGMMGTDSGTRRRKKKKGLLK